MSTLSQITQDQSTYSYYLAENQATQGQINSAIAAIQALLGPGANTWGDIFSAMNIAMFVLLPSVLQEQESSMGLGGAAMNMGSDLQNYISDMENQFNALLSSTSPFSSSQNAATQFMTDWQDLFTAINSPTYKILQQLLGSSTVNQIWGALNDIGSLTGVNGATTTGSFTVPTGGNVGLSGIFPVATGKPGNSTSTTIANNLTEYFAYGVPGATSGSTFTLYTSAAIGSELGTHTGYSYIVNNGNTFNWQINPQIFALGNGAGIDFLGALLSLWGQETSPPAPQIQSIRNDFQTMNQSVGSVSQAQQTQSQYQANELQQYFATTNSIYTSAIHQEKTPAQNLKT